MNNFYYLETSSLFRLSRWIVDNREIAKAICYTSFLSIFELLSGITQHKYAQRIGILRNLNNSTIPINWNTPREIIAESFTEVLVVDKFRQRIQRLLSLAIKSATFDELNMESAKNRDAISLEELSGLDFKVSFGHSEQVQDQICQMRSEVPPEKIKKACDLLEGSQTFRDSLTQQNRKQEIEHLATYVAANMPGIMNQKCLLRVLSSYNGRIDNFLKAESFRQAKRLLKGEPPGRNDFFDVSHILYLERDDQSIVTDDDLLIHICNELFPTQYLSSAGFLEKYG